MPKITQIQQETPADIPPIRTAAYCRVSSDSADQLHSYAAQIKFYTEYIRQLPNTVLADIYCDEACTGTKTDKREDLKRLIADARRGKLDRLLVKSVSRFARNTYDCLETVRLLKKYGVTVFFEEQNLDTAEMSDEFLLQTCSMQAQEESQTISKNMKWAIRERMERGEFIGTAAYGYTVSGQTLTIHEEEAAIVRRIFDMYLSGLGKQTIANTLNAEGLTHRGKKWQHTTVAYILQNERAIGDALLQKKYSTDFPYRRVRNRGETPQWYVENNHPAIIDRPTYEAAQQLQSSKSGGEHRRSLHTLTQKIRCPDCGHAYRRMVINQTVYWMCNQAAQTGGCASPRLPEDAIYEAFLLLVNKLHLHREHILPPLIAQLEQLQKRHTNTSGKIYEIDRQIAELNSQNLVVARHREKGFIDAAEFAARSSAVNQKIGKLRAERRKLLSEDENDALIDQLTTLNEQIAGLDGVQTTFSEALFADTVERITAADQTTLCFRLLGGLELDATISYQKRR